MAGSVKTVPEGYHTLTPYFMVDDGSAAVEFYQRALGAQVTFRIDDPKGRLMHAEMRIGNSMAMIGEWKDLDPRGDKSYPRVTLYVYVDDCDAVHQAAVDAGAKSLGPVQDQYYGDRNGGIEDPFGIMWWIATHKEDVPPEELKRRSDEHLRQREAKGK
jgi:PhnB protein